MVDRKTTSHSQKNKSCLLIDDDDDDKEIFCIALAEVNPAIQCFTANNGIEALEMLGESFVPDYIFLDLNMPLMSGKECLVEIRKRKHLDNTPVIIYSTSASERDVHQTSELGASGFITKPPLMGALIEKLAVVFEEQSVGKR